jgi:hypothetical protein
MYWLQRIVSWPIRKIATLFGWYEPCLDFDFVAGTYTNDKLWPFRRNVLEVLTITGSATLTAEGLRVDGEDGKAFVTMATDRRLSDDELRKMTE